MKDFFNIIFDLFGFTVDKYMSKTEKRKQIADKFYFFALVVFLIIVISYYLRKS